MNLLKSLATDFVDRNGKAADIWLFDEDQDQTLLIPQSGNSVAKAAHKYSIKHKI